jgi:hypothetical protein
MGFMNMSNHVESPSLDPSFGQAAPPARLERAAEALRQRGHAAHIVAGAEEARALVHTLLPPGKGVLTASSETLRLSGITADIDDSGLRPSVRRQAAALDGDMRAQFVLGAAPDVVIGSVHAVTEDGVMVAASATGSQLAPYAAGAGQAILVVGAQKVVPDLETALRRVRTYSLPKEWERCRQAYGRPSFIGKILIVEREALPDRSTVILLRESIGF